MLYYPATVRPDGPGFMVSFRDIPEALTSGETLEEAIEFASDALVSAMDFYFEDRREVALPSAPKKGEVLVGLPVSIAAKVLLLNEMVRKRVGPTELAKRLSTTPQSVSRIVDLHHATKIDTISDALKALGKRLVIEVKEAI